MEHVGGHHDVKAPVRIGKAQEIRLRKADVAEFLALFSGAPERVIFSVISVHLQRWLDRTNRTVFEKPLCGSFA